ncbi:hypothetical protein AAC387_Pa02g2231 [Persea americana]
MTATSSSSSFLLFMQQRTGSLATLFYFSGIIEHPMAWQPCPLDLHLHSTYTLLCSDDGWNLLEDAATSPSFSEHSAVTPKSSPPVKSRSFFSEPSLE